jgi:hypothetical protein
VLGLVEECIPDVQKAKARKQIKKSKGTKSIAKMAISSRLKSKKLKLLAQIQMDYRRGRH